MGPAEIAQGPLFIGFFFNTLLYGILVIQGYIYITTFKGDRPWIKTFVIFLFIAETTNTVFDFVYLYDALIRHFDDVPFLAWANWVFSTDPALTGIIAAAVQVFFAWRVKILTGKIWLVVLIIACAAAGFFGALATSIACGIVPQFIEFQKFKVVVIIWLAAECVGDIIITTSLVGHLRRHKTGFTESDEVVDRIIRMTVQTGMVTSLCAVIDLILFLVDTSGTHLIFNIPLAKLYTNSLVSSLNARAGWRNDWSSQFTQRNGGSAQSSNSLSQRSNALRRATPDMLGLSTLVPRPEVFVHVEAREMTDKARSANIDSRPMSKKLSEACDDAGSRVTDCEEGIVKERNSRCGDDFA